MKPLRHFLALLLAAAGLHAQQITLNVGAGQLTNNSDVPLGDGRLVLLLADTGGDGFGALFNGSNLAIGSFLNANDQIIGAGQISEFDFPGQVSIATDPLTPGASPFGSLAVGQAVAVVWFPGVNYNAATLGSNVAYGLFTTTSPLDGSDAWTIPSGTDATINFLTNFVIIGGVEQPGLGSYDRQIVAAANLTTVNAIPEPSAWAATFGALALAVARWARRRRA